MSLAIAVKVFNLLKSSGDSTSFFYFFSNLHHWKMQWISNLWSVRNSQMFQYRSTEVQAWIHPDSVFPVFLQTSSTQLTLSTLAHLFSVSSFFRSLNLHLPGKWSHRVYCHWIDRWMGHKLACGNASNPLIRRSGPLIRLFQTLEGQVYILREREIRRSAKKIKRRRFRNDVITQRAGNAKINSRFNLKRIRPTKKSRSTCRA